MKAHVTAGAKRANRVESNERVLDKTDDKSPQARLNALWNLSQKDDPWLRPTGSDGRREASICGAPPIRSSLPIPGL